MSAAGELDPSPPPTTISRTQIAWGLVGTAVFFWIVHRTGVGLGSFPESWYLGLGEPLNEFQRWVVVNRQSHWLFVYFFEPFSTAADTIIRAVENGLLWLPWPVVPAAVFLIAQRVADLRTALLTTACTIALGALGLWEASMATLALMLVSVLVALGLGIPLGIWTARNDRAEQILRPILDAMQTMPAFVYLVPVVLFFGVARVPSMVATVIYALPPAIRLTNLGLRSVSADTLEAARSFGTTERQLLYKVQIPMALPTIMAGVNQTIMMALAIVVIAAFIGSGGLGDVVLKSLRRLEVGQAFEAGLGIVLLAVLLDRLSYAFSQIERRSQPSHQSFRLFSERWRHIMPIRTAERILDQAWTTAGRLPDFVADRTPLNRSAAYWLTTAGVLAGLTAVCFAAGTSAPARFGDGVVWSGPLIEYPTGGQVSIRQPIDTAVNWAQRNLYEITTIGSIPIGTGPFSDFVIIYLVRPLTTFLTTGLSWPVVVLLTTAAAYAVNGRKLAAGTAVGLVGMGLLGMWTEAMQTLAQVIVAVLLTVTIGVPLGMWSGRSETVAKILRPVLDFLQTIPAFVYLVPVIMLFNPGSVPGIIASVLYALPPVIRLTGLGIRQVDQAAVEAAESFGSTGWQTLGKVQLPLALPSIMLGVNQTVMMVLAMVIIAGLIGGAGLGYEVVYGLAQNELGRGIEAGLAIVLMAIVIDRITQAWADRQAEAANVGGMHG